MNIQHKPEAHESFDPLDYEELHRNLYTISTLIRGMGWGAIRRGRRRPRRDGTVQAGANGGRGSETGRKVFQRSAQLL